VQGMRTKWTVDEWNIAIFLVGVFLLWIYTNVEKAEFEISDYRNCCAEEIFGYAFEASYKDYGRCF